MARAGFARAPACAIACALAATVALPATAASCLVLASHPDGKALAQVEAARGRFAISYVHSVTRTPVVENYRVDGATIVETELRFEQHGPGLPTEADAGGTWREEGGRFVVTMNRRFPAIAMRVHADQSPRLAVDGDPRAVNLAQWGNRALALSVRPGACLTGPPPGGRGGR